ncbi:hypothetical protein D5086_007173, partial [Populus alba]
SRAWDEIRLEMYHKALDVEFIGQPGFSRVIFCNEPQLHKRKPYKYTNNSDLNVNTRTVKARAGNGLFVDKLWSGLSVGDVVKVNKDEYFPSDLLLLSSSYEDGVCYVETMNLDGETNLKVKRCLEVTLDLNEDAKFSELKATIRYSDPLFNSSKPVKSGFLQFTRALIFLCMSPSKLSKVLEAMFINKDLQMYDEATYGFRTLAFAYRTLEHAEFSRSLHLQNMKQFHAMKEDIVHQIESSCQETDTDSPFALVVDGRALEIALKLDEKDQSFISF